jgi:ActR/RegA family two-component response regulator
MMKVLLVDDEAPFVDALSKRLDKRGIKVVSAFSGEEALQKLGALDYLMKPCDIGVLLTKLKEAKAKKDRQEAKIAEERTLNIVLRKG